MNAYKPAPQSARRFTRTVQDFKCERCGTEVKGNGYTDHCPNCLVSKHVDVMPGDRASPCGGLMEPIAAEYKGGEYKLTYECTKCMEHKTVKAASNDNTELLIELSVARV